MTKTKQLAGVMTLLAALMAPWRGLNQDGPQSKTGPDKDGIDPAVAAAWTKAGAEVGCFRPRLDDIEASFVEGSNGIAGVQHPILNQCNAWRRRQRRLCDHDWQNHCPVC